MQTSSKKAFEKLDKQQDNSKFVVPSSSTNMQASKNANWNHGYQTISYVSTNKDQFRGAGNFARPNKQDQISKVNAARKQ